MAPPASVGTGDQLHPPCLTGLWGSPWIRMASCILARPKTIGFGRSRRRASLARWRAMASPDSDLVGTGDQLTWLRSAEYLELPLILRATFTLLPGTKFGK